MYTPFTNGSLKKRIFNLSYKYKLSHIGSCITAVDIIDAVYNIKKKDEPFILSSGHAGVALYTVLEKRKHISADILFLKHGVHPNRDIENGIYCSTGSLGQGLPIALGMAIADQTINVYCLCSDGEMMEGSIWETIRIADELGITNLKLLINANGWGANREISPDFILYKLRASGWGVIKNTDKDKMEEDIKDSIQPTQTLPIAVLFITNPQYVFLSGQEGHYIKLSEDDYKYCMETMKK
jgi:transketolase